MPAYPGLLLRILGPDEPAFGPGRARLIALIEEEGSISAAARRMGMSYRRAWQLVESVNRSFVEPVVVKEVGGRAGGGARVTAFGRSVLARYRTMEDKASAAIARDLSVLEGQLRRVDR